MTPRLSACLPAILTAKTPIKKNCAIAATPISRIRSGSIIKVAGVALVSIFESLRRIVRGDSPSQESAGRMPGTLRCILSLVAIMGLAQSDAAAADLPTAIQVLPPQVHLAGPRATRQLLVTGMYPGDLTADLSRDATYESLAGQVAAVSPSGIVTSCGDGQTEIVVRAAGFEARITVTVTGVAAAEPVDFNTEVVAALARGGCSQGACHGSPQGKNGFRLSLRGYKPELDFGMLTRETFARRTNTFDPRQSLMLLKASGRVPHQGGVRFQETDAAYRLLHTWIAEDCRASSDARKLVRLEVLPSGRRLHVTSPWQQLAALAHFDDGSIRDVTDLVVFTSSNEPAVSVSSGGLVEFHETAEATILARYLDRVVGAPLVYVRHDPAFVFAAPLEANEIDRWVFAKQRSLELNPAGVCSDPVFLRRVYLDLIGTLPSPAEALAFLDSTASDRRARLIDELLARPEFASFWAMKWADVMRGNRETISERGVHALHRYLVKLFRDDRPFNEFARELLTSQGNTIHQPAANFFRISPAPEDAAESMAQLFLGVRIQCARCHNHPFETITQNDYYSLAAYFARVRVKGERFGLDDALVFLTGDGEVKHPTTGEAVGAAAFGEVAVAFGPEDDRRDRLVEWLTRPDNRWFARSTVNRIWYHLLGRGIVEPIDDFRDTNPPSIVELLDGLAAQFVAAGYRVRPVIRSILNSHTYQLAADPVVAISTTAAADRYFTRAEVRMLTAEQVLDAICAVTGVPEQFEGYPPGTRAIELAEGAVPHQFLKAFARPVRDTACDCARETEPSLGESLHLVNNADVLAKIESPQGRLAGWLREGRSATEVVELLYLAALSRRPTVNEVRIATDHVTAVGNASSGLADLQHALINSNEFLLRH